MQRFRITWSIKVIAIGFLILLSQRPGYGSSHKTLNCNEDEVSSAGDQASKLQYLTHYRRAAALFRYAADCGDAGSQVQLADMYRDGRGVSKNIKKAIQYWLRAATENKTQLERFYAFAANDEAKLDLAHTYQQEGNYAQALRWYRAALRDGYTGGEAQYGLGTMYESGQGVRQSCSKARALYEISTARGNDEATDRLLYFYSHGVCARQDKVKAYALWLWEGMDGYDPHSKFAREGDELQNSLSGVQLKEAYRLEKEWEKVGYRKN